MTFFQPSLRSYSRGANAYSSYAFAVTPWHTSLVCAITGLGLVVLGALPPMGTLGIRHGGSFALVSVASDEDRYGMIPASPGKHGPDCRLRRAGDLTPTCRAF